MAFPPPFIPQVCVRSQDLTGPSTPSPLLSDSCLVCVRSEDLRPPSRHVDETAKLRKLKWLWNDTAIADAELKIHNITNGV
jgi:hypothetical protein